MNTEMKYQPSELKNNQFLTDKEWWIEETNKRYILCVKYNGKIYRSGREKEHVNDAKSLDSKLLKESVAATLIMQIRIQINEDKVAELEKQRF
ncbi:MAG: hypothetical protein MRERV_68c008 [Mycoplasmataceae bacterium RV_VA103A]|nr:MAG: hypothetical protein MRERV_68c008 [Mycoplasmataceae bacterium RV_VA103A]